MPRPFGFKHTKETKEKMRNNHKGMLGKKHKKKTKIKMGVKSKGRKPMMGKQHTAETKRRMSKNRTGCNNANWKNGITSTIRGIRRSPMYYQWRKKVLKRDKYTCQICGNNSKLHAHHIIPILECPEKIFNIENGITLCEKCHLGGCHK